MTALLPRLWEALRSAGLARAELLVVDDASRDGTAELCARLAAEGMPIRMIERIEPADGLSGAVLAGFAEARGTVLVCMDADGQHPVEAVPALVAALKSSAMGGRQRPFALGSRYIRGGRVVGAWTLFRRLNSGAATLLARPFARGVTDPMSGMFALHRATFDQAARLAPTGYKIALELMCKCRVDEVVEVPISFGMRMAGLSKLSLREQTRYLEHLSRLYDFHFPRASPILKFVIASGLGWLAAGLVSWGLHIFPVGLAAAAVANQIVLFLFFRRYVLAQRRFIVMRRPWTDFVLIASAEMGATLTAGVYVFRRVPTAGRWEVLALGLVAGILVRYILRKEFLHDLRGLRADLRVIELHGDSRAARPGGKSGS